MPCRSSAMLIHSAAAGDDGKNPPLCSDLCRAHDRAVQAGYNPLRPIDRYGTACISLPRRSIAGAVCSAWRTLVSTRAVRSRLGRVPRHGRTDGSESWRGRGRHRSPIGFGSPPLVAAGSTYGQRPGGGWGSSLDSRLIVIAANGAAGRPAGRGSRRTRRNGSCMHA
jgi:hypothetical protein